MAAAELAGPLTYEPLPGRVVFGAGAVDAVAAEVERLGGERALLIDGLFDPERRARVEGDLGSRHAGTIDEVAQHVPAEGAAARRRGRGSSAPTAWSRSAAARRPASRRRSPWRPGCRSSPSRPPTRARR